jgi:hypothetical protein
MLIVLAATLATTVGLLAAFYALILLGREPWRRQDKPWSPRVMGALSILGGGFLLMLGGRYKLDRELHHESQRVEEIAVKLARMVVVLQGPIGKITVQVSGDNPFADKQKTSSLRVRVATKAGSNFVSEIAASQMKRVETDDEDSVAYELAWHSLLAGVTSPEGRRVAERIVSINDLRSVESLEADIVVRAPERVRMPESLVINFDPNNSVAVFEGQPIGKLVQKEDVWVAVFKDADLLADKLNAWQESNYYEEREQAIGKPFGGSVALGVVLLVVGVILLRNAAPPDLPGIFTAEPVQPVAAPPVAATPAAPSPAPTPLNFPELSSAQALRISYTIDNKTKALTLNEPSEVQPILRAFAITGEERKIDVRFFPLGSVDFLIPPQKEINAKFVSPTQIELENWGQIYIRDEFYEKICAIVSKAEGKPIDILKNNR